MTFDFSSQRGGTCSIIMLSLKCEKYQRYLHPVKKNFRTVTGVSVPFCYWCLIFLNKEDPKGLLLHVFHCVNHPLKHSQKKMSALDWGQIRCHLPKTPRSSGWEDAISLFGV